MSFLKRKSKVIATRNKRKKFDETCFKEVFTNKHKNNVTAVENDAFNDFQHHLSKKQEALKILNKLIKKGLGTLLFLVYVIVFFLQYTHWLSKLTL